jgi:HAD superfamily hydrolase (TIGR01450 family)
MRSDDRALDSVILDVDGVLWIAGALDVGATTFLDRLRGNDIPFCLLTNDCSVSKAERHESLTKAGLLLRADQLVTAAEVTKVWLQDAATQVIMYLGAESAFSDIATGLCVRHTGPVDAVVVGDLFTNFDRHSLDAAANAVGDGAALVAMQRNPRWSDGRTWYVDNGFWVAGLEYVTGHQAVVTGKPSPGAYLTALARLGVSPALRSRTAFVSDDVATDLKGAKTVGLTTVYIGHNRMTLPWVDYSVPDLAALSSFLSGELRA